MRILNAGEGGVQDALSTLLLNATGDDRCLPPCAITVSNLTADTAEKSGQTEYPALYVFCERATNDLREKFRTFAGPVVLAIDVRVTHDRSDEVARLLGVCVDAVTEVLDRARGDWRPGVYYPGGYEVTFAAAKKGGRNFLQTAKVRLEVIVSL